MTRDVFMAWWNQLRQTQRFPCGIFVADSGCNPDTYLTWLKPMLCYSPVQQHGEAQEVQTCGQCPMCLRLHLERSPNHWVLRPQEKVSVTLEEIRQMEHALHLSHRSDTGMPFVVIVPDASHITVSGWNVMLKILEEPPTGVLFLIFGKQSRLLPQTIRSRLVHMYVPESDTESTCSGDKERAGKLAISDFAQFIARHKPQGSQEWLPYVSDMFHAMRLAVESGQWDRATYFAGAYLELSDVLSRRYRDTSINIKYAFSEIVARYETPSS